MRGGSVFKLHVVHHARAGPEAAAGHSGAGANLRQSDLAQPVEGAELRRHLCAARLETQLCDRGQVMVVGGEGEGSPQVPQGTGCWLRR